MGRPRHPKKSRDCGLTDLLSTAGPAAASFTPTAAPLPSKKEIELGTDLAAAREAVTLVNARRSPNPVQRVINRIRPPSSILDDHLDWFDTNIAAGMGSEQTLYESRRKFRRIRAAFRSNARP
jgi:hypothetical protein